MGMYDEIICDYPLPGTPPAFVKPGHRFQTKDLDCMLATYRISENGGFDIADFNGDVEFYTSNASSSAYGMIFTDDGSDFESVEYGAVFSNSQLTSLVETSHTRKPALSVDELRKRDTHVRPTSEELAHEKIRHDESLIGKRVYVLMGGTNEGYHAEVVAEGEREWCLKVTQGDRFHHAGDFVSMRRFFRDHLLWDSEEEAKANRAKECEEWERNKRELEAMLAKQVA